MLIGNLGRDPEIRHTKDGRPVANFSIATTDRWTDKSSSEKKERTEWHNVVIFNETLVKIAEQYMKKGSRVFIEGALATRKWTDNGGHERFATEIVLRGYSGTLIMLNNRDGPAPDEGSYGTTRSSAGHQPPAKDELDDEIPF